MRLLVELVLFFILPVLVSAFLYVNIAVRLIKRTKQAGRNHVLTLAFSLSWLFWVICWSPNAFVLAKKNYEEAEYFRCRNYGGSDCDYEYEYDYEYYEFYYSGISRFDFVVSYAILFRIPFQLLYSHLNPLLYLLVLKKFQDHHKKIFLGFFHLILSTKQDARIQRSSSSHILFELIVQASKILKTLITCCSICLLGFSMVACIYHEVGVLQSVLHTQRDATEKASRLNTQRAFFPLKFYTPIRSFCADHNGIINVDYRRCFLLSTHLPKYLNFTAHLEYCEQEGTTMCYPRSHDEMRFMYNMLAQWAPENLEPRLPWRHLNGEGTFRSQDESYKQWYLDYIEQDPLSRYHIHVGFVKTRENLFTSIDGQFNISSQTHNWFQSKYSKRPYFVGPSACLSSSVTTLWECTPSWSTPETFCCKDFFYKTALRTPSGT